MNPQKLRFLSIWNLLHDILSLFLHSKKQKKQSPKKSMYYITRRLKL